MKVYLSSTFSARENGMEDLLQLRQELKALGARRGVTVVLGEEDAAINAAPGNHLLIMERCAQLIGQCNAFFGMVFERHGSAIVLECDPALVSAEVSFFEAELLEACFKSLTCHVVRARELTPSPAMQEFLGLVSSTLGNDLMEVERATVAQHFDDFCRSLTGSAPGPSPWLFTPSRSAVRTRHRPPLTREFR